MPLNPDAAIHEAGHQVVAEVFDLPVAEAHLSPDGDSGYVRFDDAAPLEESWSAAVASVAGAVAECIASDVPAEEGRDRLSDSDLEALETFAELREDGSLDLTPAVKRAESEARSILEERWPKVLDLAEELREAAEGSS